MSVSRPYENVFGALEDDPAVAADLGIRSRMMIRLRSYIDREGIPQKEAARRMGVSQSRINDLKRGRIDRFTTDLLAGMLSRTEQRETEDRADTEAAGKTLEEPDTIPWEDVKKELGLVHAERV